MGLNIGHALILFTIRTDTILNYLAPSIAALGGDIDISARFNGRIRVETTIYGSVEVKTSKGEVLIRRKNLDDDSTKLEISQEFVGPTLTPQNWKYSKHLWGLLWMNQ